MEEEIRDWIRKNHGKLGLKSCDIREVRTGESNYNVILEADQKYVLRVSREVSRKDRLENEYRILELLENEDISDVPRAVKFDKTSWRAPMLLETFVGDEDLDADDFNPARLSSLAKTLAQIHSIPVEKIEDRDLEASSLKDIYLEDFQEWAKEPFEEYLENVEEPDKRIIEAFERQKELIREVPEAGIDLSLVHGDLGFNVRSSGSKTYIVDWEYSRTGYPGHDILYFFEHERLDEKQRRIFLDEYRKHRELGEAFEYTRKYYPKFLAFNDAIWAANRAEKEGSEKHSELLEERLEYLEKLYSED